MAEYLTEEVSEPERDLVCMVRTTPYPVPAARRVVLFLVGAAFPGVGVITIAPPQETPWDGQELVIIDGDAGLTATRTVSFTGPVVAGDPSTANSAGATLRYIYSQELDKWKKV